MKFKVGQLWRDGESDSSFNQRVIYVNLVCEDIKYEKKFFVRRCMRGNMFCR